MRTNWWRISLGLVTFMLAFTFFVSVEKLHAQSVPRDTRTWIDPSGSGLSITFSTPESSDTCALQDDVFTEGVPDDWRLLGIVRMRHPDSGQIVKEQVVDHNGDLQLTVELPPEDLWESKTSNPSLRFIHVDVAIEVYDGFGVLVPWVGGDQVDAPGTLGPGGQNWGRSCAPLSIIMYTNDQIASDPDGEDVPLIAPGDPVTWTYRIENTGNLVFSAAEITVTDSVSSVAPVLQSVEIGNIDDYLEPGEVWIYEAKGVALTLKDSTLPILVPSVCRLGKSNVPGATAYVSTGTVDSPIGKAFATSSYCNTSVIGGMVWLDTNGNGFREDNESRYSGTVFVDLLSCDSPESTVQQTAVDEGLYSFARLRPGDYRVRFLPQSTVSFSPLGQDHSNDARNNDVDPNTGLTSCFYLPVGEEDRTWDAGVRYALFAPVVVR